ncbi:MAG: DUF2283 domain-containing protein [SAR202 cluster bacterium]|nr:DUF2283 domain-containing protein [SAR202 cluster bacterium]
MAAKTPKILAIEYDNKTDALYLRFSDSKVSYSKEITSNLIIDFDEANHPVGLDLQRATETIKRSKRLSGMFVSPPQPGNIGLELLME